MYKGLSYNYTQSSYRNILFETINIFKEIVKSTPLPLYKNILSQLLDIKENIVEKHYLVDPEEIDERYSLGGIAVKNFEEGDELRERLFDIFSGACDYIIMDK